MIGQYYALCTYALVGPNIWEKLATAQKVLSVQKKHPICEQMSKNS